jgi:hypothetical protein
MSKKQFNHSTGAHEDHLIKPIKTLLYSCNSYVGELHVTSNKRILDKRIKPHYQVGYTQFQTAVVNAYQYTGLMHSLTSRLLAMYC